MNILVVGAGAREHAILWKLRQSPKVDRLYAAPGNGGTASLADNFAIAVDDVPRLIDAAKRVGADLTIVGPEVPLAIGIVDTFQEAGLAVFGPSQDAAIIESSKVFAKGFMERHGIPTARSASFFSYAEAKRYLNGASFPLVVKADGLAAGKGVIVAGDPAEAEQALQTMMVEKAFGAAGERIIIEEFLSGTEVSLLAFTDGETVIPMTPACDYKRVYDGDEGLNTGGMGSFSPPASFGPAQVDLARRTILEPAVRGLAEEGRTFKGVLYAGLMVTDQGLKVLEFNCRFGDPETQVILPRLESDLAEVYLAVARDELGKVHLSWSPDACVGVVLASGGYPGHYETGRPVSGLDRLPSDVWAFHAGTKAGPDGELLTDGGRVVTLVARGANLDLARRKVYAAIPKVHFHGMHYRTDIAAVGTNAGVG